MKIIIDNYEIEKLIDENGKALEPVCLIDICPSYWNKYCIIEAMLYHHVKRFDNETGKHYMHYPYRKRFHEYYNGSSFIIDLEKDFSNLHYNIA